MKTENLGESGVAQDAGERGALEASFGELGFDEERAQAEIDFGAVDERAVTLAGAKGQAGLVAEDGLWARILV